MTSSSSSLLILTIIAVSLSAVIAATPDMMSYGQGQATIPSSYPDVLKIIYPLGAGPIPDALYQTMSNNGNTTPAALCAPQVRYTYDYYWAMCFNTDPTVDCVGLVGWILRFIPECIETRNSLVPGAKDYGWGFWSSSCRCFPVIRQLLYRITSGTSNQTFSSTSCTGNAWTSMNDDLNSLFLGSMPDSLNVFASASVEFHADRTAQPNVIANLEAMGPPSYLQLLNASLYHCNITHDPGNAVLSTKDQSPYYDALYTWNLFWTIPPPAPAFQRSASAPSLSTPSSSSSLILPTVNSLGVVLIVGFLFIVQYCLQL